MSSCEGLLGGRDGKSHCNAPRIGWPGRGQEVFVHFHRPQTAIFNRMLQNPTNYRFSRVAGQRVRSAEVAMEMMNGRPVRILRSVFNMLTFKSDGTLVSAAQDRHVRARVALALAIEIPAQEMRPNLILE